ncbi:MAG: hypothetical protein Unbinned2990contig1001_44 [Prokaryotic dsDNA virus sp.]|nr:MAG: hypothetical protein Unbinned2990contig1001_44 [Prokaryotic dsDNA virus sp.]|tara:strand:+ start:25218 stop:25403 length:186 start_codon:yes stop_codon:yes gene_type:complete
MKYSKTLKNIADKDPRINEYYFDEDGHWIYLEEGYEVNEVQTIHEYNVAKCIRDIKLIYKK